MNPRPRTVLVLLAVIAVAAGAAVVTLRRDRADTLGRPAGEPAATSTPPTEPATVAEAEATGPERCRGILLREGLAGALRPPQHTRFTPASVARGVEDVRGLRFRRLPSPTYLPRNRVAARAARFVDDYPPEREAVDEAALVALGALAPGDDLRSILSRALGDQVVGFYDDESGELVVASEAGASLDAEAAVTLAHELEHALADQAFELPGGDVPPPGQEDADAAAAALVEGDATLTMQLWALRNLSLGEQLDLVADGLGGLASLPDFVQRSLLFPYTEGLGFVCARYEAGGWAAVDAAYRDPPSSTAEVLFPERYGRGESPVDLAPPAAPGPQWKALGHAAVGAADLLFLFEAPGGDPRRALDRPRARAGAWAGGRVDVWAAGDRRAVTVTLAQRPGAPSLCESMRTFASRARIRATVTCPAGTVRLTSPVPSPPPNSRQ